MTDLAPPRIAIVAYGKPITQGSKTRNRFGMHDDNAKTLHPWRKTVRAAAEDATRYTDTITGPVRVWMRFGFARPASHYRTGRNSHLIKDSAPRFPVHKNDLDKLQRAVLDSLTHAEVWVDDGLAVDIRARKFYAGEHEQAPAQPGVHIIIEELS